MGDGVATKLASQSVTVAVRADAAQSFIASQQTQARSNIYAAPLDAMAYSGMQVNGLMEVSQESGNKLDRNQQPLTLLMVIGWSRVNGTMAGNRQQVADAPPGYANSVKLTITTAQASLTGTERTHSIVQLKLVERHVFSLVRQMHSQSPSGFGRKFTALVCTQVSCAYPILQEFVPSRSRRMLPTPGNTKP